MPAERGELTQAEAAREIIKCSRQMLAKWCDKGLIPCRRDDDGHVYIRRRDAESFAEDRDVRRLQRAIAMKNEAEAKVARAKAALRRK